MSPNARNGARLAVLIDAENISAKYIEPLLENVARLGTATAKRVYGDWTEPQHSSWRTLLNLHALIPVQQFRLSRGKNSTDCALIIDAMDLLYTGHFDGFCLVSSDSDFSRLAIRIRETGLTVYGFGESKTPISFVKACDRFIALESMMVPAPPEVVRASPPILARVGTNGVGGAKGVGPSKQSPRPKVSSKKDQGLIDLVNSAYLAVASEEGWVHLGAFGAQLHKLLPSFDPRNYGCKKLKDFAVAMDFFEIRKVTSARNPLSEVWYLKVK